jgi:hypothetical protein
MRVLLSGLRLDYRREKPSGVEEVGVFGAEQRLKAACSGLFRAQTLIRLEKKVL